MNSTIIDNYEALGEQVGHRAIIIAGLEPVFSIYRKVFPDKERLFRAARNTAVALEGMIAGDKEFRDMIGLASRCSKGRRIVKRLSKPYGILRNHIIEELQAIGSNGSIRFNRGLRSSYYSAAKKIGMDISITVCPDNHDELELRPNK